MSDLPTPTNGRIVRDNTGQRFALPILGTLRIGEKRKNDQGKEYPVSLDYFKATGDYAYLFDEAYPVPPKRLQVIFASDDNNDSCLEEFDARDPQGKRAGYGNGVDVWLYDHSFGNYVKYHSQDDRPAILAYSKQHQLKWRVVCTLYVVLPAVRGVFGVWRFVTRGEKSSVQHIVKAFDSVKAYTVTPNTPAGTVINIPFDLIVEKVSSQKPGSSGRKFPVVRLIPNLTQKNLDLVKGYLNQGGNLRELSELTPEKLANLASPSELKKLIEPPIF